MVTDAGPLAHAWTFARANSLLMVTGAVIALVWANLDPEGYERVTDPLHFVVNDIAMSFFFGLAMKEIVEATAPGDHRTCAPLRRHGCRCREAGHRPWLGDSMCHRHRVQLHGGPHHLPAVPRSRFCCCWRSPTTGWAWSCSRPSIHPPRRSRSRSSFSSAARRWKGQARRPAERLGGFARNRLEQNTRYTPYVGSAFPPPPRLRWTCRRFSEGGQADR
jgi:hypothetical protein